MVVLLVVRVVLVEGMVVEVSQGVVVEDPDVVVEV